MCAGESTRDRERLGEKTQLWECSSPCHAHLEPTFNSAKAEVVKKKQQEQRLDGDAARPWGQGRFENIAAVPPSEDHSDRLKGEWLGK